MLFALPASASTPSLRPVTGPMLSGSTSEQVVDGFCPDTSDPGFPPGAEEPHQLWSADIAHGNGVESLGLGMCWQVTGALGGNGIDLGTFKLIAAHATLKGTLSGAESYNRYNLFDFTLHIASGTGRLKGATGTLTFYGCENGGGTIVAGALRTRPLNSSKFPHPYPPLCFPPV